MTPSLARLLIVLVLALVLGAPVGSTPATAQGCPTFPYILPDNLPATLTAAVVCANSNGSSDDVIDLNGQTITFTSAYSSSNALPSLTSPLTLRNGTLTRSGTSQFRFIYTIDTSLTLISMTLTNGYGSVGGALMIDNHTSPNSFLTVYNSTLSGNGAANEGAAIRARNSTVNIYNSVISGNSGASAITADGQIDIRNTTIAGNYGNNYHPGGIQITSNIYVSAPSFSLRNSILWGNSGLADYVVASGVTTTLQSNIIELETGSNPLFVSEILPSSTPSTAGDFTLEADSPAIDAGNNSVVVPDVFDVDGDGNTSEDAPDRTKRVRRFDSGAVSDTGTGSAPLVDIGAYETIVYGVTLSETTASVAEGGTTDSYTVVLDAQPTADVTVAITSTAEASASASSLTFTTANWNTPQTVTITAANDRIYEADHSATLTHSTTSADSNYNGLTLGSVTASITDNESMTYFFAETTRSVSESATETDFQVSLTINADGSGDFGYDLPFTIAYLVNGSSTANGNDYTIGSNASFTASQNLPSGTITSPITLTLVNDTLIEADETIIVTLGAGELGTSGSYAAGINRTEGTTGESIQQTLTILDDEERILLTEPTASVAEGGTIDTYGIRLLQQPTADVTVTITGTTQASVNPSSLTFTAANWSTVQNVDVTAVDDAVIEGAHTTSITHATSSTDTNYNGVSVPSVSVSITDNDVAAMVVSKTSTTVTEGGATDTYDISLSTMPSAEVGIDLINNASAQFTVSATDLTFTAANWSMPQTVTITAVDDALIEGAHTATLMLQTDSNDEDYDSLNAIALTVNITDNDALPSNLLLNNSFETALGSEWVGDNLLATDRRMCSGALSGACMFRFNSSAASSTLRTLSQTVISSGWGEAGDTLNFAVQAQALSYTGAMRMIVSVNYTDGTTARQRLLLPTGSYGYGQRVVSIVLTKPLASVRVTLEARNDTGVMRFDNARLRLLPGAQNSAAPLALPDPQ